MDVADGDLYVASYLETFHVTDKSWAPDQLTATAERNGWAVQFLRALGIGCDTGTVLTFLDTALDGAPYALTGRVGQCG